MHSDREQLCVGPFRFGSFVFLVWGSHTQELYSSLGLTKDMYSRKLSFICCEEILRLRFRKFSWRFAFEVILSTRLFHFISDCMVMPEYVVAVSGFSLFFTVSETNSTKTSQNVSNSKVWTCLFYSGRVDYITIEILKADIETTTKHLEKLVNNIWEKEVVSSDWNKGLIVKIPKKGDRAVCDNYTCITLLSTSSKVFSKIIVQRIQREVEKKANRRISWL